MLKKFIKPSAVLASLVSLMSLAACGSSEESDGDDQTGGDTSTGGKTAAGGDAGGGNEGGAHDGSGGGAGADSAESVYGIGTLVVGAEVSVDYLLLVRDLAFGGAELELDDAREFAGNSDLASEGGDVLVASGDEPKITKYEVDSELALTKVGEVGFTSYGLVSAAFWNNQFVAKNKAYMVNGISELIIWNPETMEIEGTIALPSLEARAGLKLVAGLADRASVVHDGKFYLPMYWTDDNYAMRSDDSVIVVVDVASDTVVDIIPADCPGLDYGTADDDGTLYFSNWTGGVGTYYVLDTAQNCVAIVDPGREGVETMAFASLTGGHEGAAFKYAGDGKFVMSVFDEERADIENAEDPFVPVGGLNWRLFSYEPAASDRAVLIDDVDWNSGAIIHTRVGDQFYSMVPGADYTSTVVYSVDGTSAEPVFGITGWSFRLFQVR